MAVPKITPRRRKFSHRIHQDVSAELDPISVPFTLPWAHEEASESNKYGFALKDRIHHGERLGTFYAWTSQPHLMPRLAFAESQEAMAVSESARMVSESLGHHAPRWHRLMIGAS